MTILWIICVPWALLTTFALPSAFQNSFFTGLICLAISWGPVALLTHLAIRKATRRQAWHADALALAGVQAGDGQHLMHTEGDTTIVLNQAGRTLTLSADGHCRSYPWHDVRGWESVKERAGQTVGVGVQGSLAAAGANVAAIRQANAATGFFVTVRDIEHPKWRIAMQSEKEQARWMEILRQSINES